jgi:hypothetical protein
MKTLLILFALLSLPLYAQTVAPLAVQSAYCSNTGWACIWIASPGNTWTMYNKKGAVVYNVPGNVMNATMRGLAGSL